MIGAIDTRLTMSAPARKPWLRSRKKGYKFCSECRAELPLTADFFAPSKTIRCGFTSRCRPCDRRRAKLWRQSPEGRERRNQYLRGYRIPEPRHSAGETFPRKSLEEIDRLLDQLAEERHQRSSERCARLVDQLLSYLADADVDGVGHNRKRCRGCEQVFGLWRFESDRRYRDGYTSHCLDCLPSRKHPTQASYSLDSSFSDANLSTGYDVTADKNAPDPEQSAVHSELWDFVKSLPLDQQIFLEEYIGSPGYIAPLANRGVHAMTSEAVEIPAMLTAIRASASQRFGASYV